LSVGKASGALQDSAPHTGQIAVRIGMEHYCYSPNDFRNKLCETCLAVTKNSQILEIMQWSTTWRGADKPEHHSQFH
jgi:hypothetical protein